MYITVTIPSIRTVVTPVAGVETREDQIDALRVLSAGNTLNMVLLGGVLALQVRETARPFFLSFFFFSGLSKVECAEKSALGSFSFLSYFFLILILTCHAHNLGRAGMGSEIGIEGGGENCGRGSEGESSR